MQFENINDVILGFELEHKIRKWKRMFAKNSVIRKRRVRRVGVRNVA